MRDAILVGIVLCAAVIALFLRDVRAGLLAALAGADHARDHASCAMRLAGQTLNLMSLGGMAVAIGLVVDDAIVMIEAIARQRDAGDDPPTGRRRAARGTSRAAVIGTTLTTVVVFVPLAFLQGVVGDFFRALAFTRDGGGARVAGRRARRSCRCAAGVRRSRRRRTRTPGALARRATTRGRAPAAATAAGRGAGVALALVGAGVARGAARGRGFLPTMDEGAFVLDYFLPAGTSLADTEAFARGLEAELREDARGARRSRAAPAPSSGPRRRRSSTAATSWCGSAGPGPPRTAEEVIAEVRARLEREVPEVRVEFVQVLQDVLNDLSGAPRPIEVKLFGPDYAVLRGQATEIARPHPRVPGLVDLYPGLEGDAPELRLPRRPGARRAPGHVRCRRQRRAGRRPARASSRPRCAAPTARSACACATPTPCASTRPRSRRCRS